MKYEKPQKKNPNELVIKQHIFPSKSIRRFVQNNGTVNVKLVKQNKVIKLPPDDKLFCAKRSWDQRAETGYMKEIEDKFQTLASKIVTNKIKNIGESENRTVSEFFALWELRFYKNLNPIDDTELKEILPGKSYTKNEEEILEKSNMVFAKASARDKVSIPSRFMNSQSIQMGIYERIAQMGYLKWGIVSSHEGEFIVPDNFSNNAILPVSPNIILLWDSNNLVIRRSEVIKVNQLAISCSKTFYFAKELSSCPV